MYALSNFFKSYDSILYKEFEFSLFGWIRIGLSSSAFLLVSLSLFNIVFFSSIFRKKLRLLKHKSKQFYNTHLKNYSRMYLFLSLILLTTGTFELVEIVGHSVINSKPEIFYEFHTNNGCVLHEYTMMAALSNSHFMFLAPPIIPNLVFPLLLTFIYTFLMFTARLFTPENNNNKFKICIYSLHIFIWGTIQLCVLLLLYSNVWTLIAAPFVFSIFVLIDLLLFLIYAFYLKRVLNKSCKDVMHYTSSTQDITQIISFYKAYRIFMIIFVISILLLSISLIVTALFDGIRSSLLNHCYYKIGSVTNSDFESDQLMSKVIIITAIMLKFVSMIVFDLFVSAFSVVVCAKVFAFYRELCAVSKQQQTDPLLGRY